MFLCQFFYIGNFDAYEPIGQVFTAEDTNIEAGFSFNVINSGRANTALTYNFYSGENIAGPILSSYTFNLADGFEGFYLWDLSSIGLNIGSSYLLTVSNDDSSALWAVNGSETSYALGQAYFGGGRTPSRPTSHLALRVTPTAVGPVDVSEPSITAILALGFIGLSFRRNNKQ